MTFSLLDLDVARTPIPESIQKNPKKTYFRGLSVRVAQIVKVGQPVEHPNYIGYLNYPGITVGEPMPRLINGSPVVEVEVLPANDGIDGVLISGGGKSVIRVTTCRGSVYSIVPV